jgi:hypothetical protein
MSVPILSTTLNIPPNYSALASCSHLSERVKEATLKRLSLTSIPIEFSKMALTKSFNKNQIETKS